MNTAPDLYGWGHVIALNLNWVILVAMPSAHYVLGRLMGRIWRLDPHTTMLLVLLYDSFFNALLGILKSLTFSNWGLMRDHVTYMVLCAICAVAYGAGLASERARRRREAARKLETVLLERTRE